MNPSFRAAIRVLATAVLAPMGPELGDTEESRINPTKPYKRRRLKMDPVSQLRRRLYKMSSRDPKVKRKRNLYRKIYTRKNKQLLKRRADFMKKAKERLPKPPGHVAPKRSSGN